MNIKISSDMTDGEKRNKSKKPGKHIKNDGQNKRNHRRNDI